MGALPPSPDASKYAEGNLKGEGNSFWYAKPGAQSALSERCRFVGRRTRNVIIIVSFCICLLLADSKHLTLFSPPFLRPCGGILPLTPTTPPTYLFEILTQPVSVTGRLVLWLCPLMHLSLRSPTGGGRLEIRCHGDRQNLPLGVCDRVCPGNNRPVPPASLWLCLLTARRDSLDGLQALREPSGALWLLFSGWLVTYPKLKMP